MFINLQDCEKVIVTSSSDITIQFVTITGVTTLQQKLKTLLTIPMSDKNDRKEWDRHNCWALQEWGIMLGLKQDRDPRG